MSRPMEVGELLALIRVDRSEFDRGVDGAERKLATSAVKQEGILAHLGAAWGTLGKAMQRAGKYAAIGVASGQAINLVAGLSQSLAPLVGLLVALPGLAFAGGAAIAVLGIGFHNLGAALAGNEKALEKLSPAQRAVYDQLKLLGPAWAKVRDEVQARLFANTAEDIQILAKVWLPMLHDQLSLVAGSMGLLESVFVRAASSSTFVQQIGDALGSLAGGLEQMTPGIAPLVAGFGALVAAASPVLFELGPAFANVGKAIGDWLVQMNASGALTQMLQDALAVLGGLGSIVVQLVGIIAAVFKAANSEGNDFLGTLYEILLQFNRFLSSAEGQAAMVALFVAIHDILAALGPALGVVLSAVGQAVQLIAPALSLIAPVVAAIATALAPLIPAAGAILASLGPVIAAVVVGLMPAVHALVPVIVLLAGILADVLGNALQLLVPIIVPIVKALAGALAPVLPKLATSFAAVAAALTPLAERLGGDVAHALDMLLPALLELVPILIDSLLPVLPPLIDGFLQLFEALFPLIPPIVSIVQAIAPMLPLWGQLIAQMVTALVPILLLTTQVLAILAGYILGAVATALKWFVDTIWGPLTKAVTGLWGMLADFTKWLTDHLLEPWHHIGEIPGMVKAVFTGIGTWLWDAGAKLIDGFINGIKSGYEKVKSALGKLTSFLPDWKGPADVDARILAPSGRLIMRGLLDGLKAGMPDVRAALGSLTLSLPDAANGAATTTTAGPTPPPAGAGAGGLDLRALARALADALAGVSVRLDGRAVGQVEADRAGLLYRTA